MKQIILFTSILCFTSVIFAQEKDENKKATIYQINIQTEINTTSRIYLNNGLKEANDLNVNAILINLNTYGGTVVDADSMRSAILYNPKHRRKSRLLQNLFPRAYVHIFALYRCSFLIQQTFPTS